MSLTEDYAPQYNTPCVLLEPLQYDADQIIDYAKRIGAVFLEDPESICYVIQFPGRPQELYTEEALRRSLRLPQESKPPSE